jgi:hypothetical protein
VGALAGLPLLPAIYLPLLLIFDRRVPWVSYAVALLLMFVIVRGSLDLFGSVLAPVEWFSFGQAAGILLDGVRRNGRRKEWLMKVVRNSYAAATLPTGKDGRLPRESRLSLRRVIPEALIVPWFRLTAPAVPQLHAQLSMGSNACRGHPRRVSEATHPDLLRTAVDRGRDLLASVAVPTARRLQCFHRNR